MLGSVLDTAGPGLEQNKPKAIMGFSFLRCFVGLCLSLCAPSAEGRKGSYQRDSDPQLQTDNSVIILISASVYARRGWMAIGSCGQAENCRDP